MSPQLIIALVIFLLGFGSAWTVQDWRMGAKENERAQQELANQRSNAAATLRRTENVIAAQNDSASRMVALRRDADNARTALAGVSDAADAALRAAADSQAACIDAATAATDVLKQSTERYRAMAETADRHVNDIQTLMAAWPTFTKKE